MGNCAACHGQNLLSAGAPAPDLRESPAALSLQTMRTVVHGGALASQGMPQFPELSDEAVRDLYMYIRDGARRVVQAR
jgi:quinohemoprotein ethanol dehydrogenase